MFIPSILLLTILSFVCAGDGKFIERQVPPINAINFQQENFQFDNIEELIAHYPDATVKELTQENDNYGSILYTLGARTHGDSLVGHKANNQRFPVAHNVNVTITYAPSSSVGPQVTYVSIKVDQSTNLGRAYIIQGGIHQRFISIGIEAYNTLYLNFDAQVYGI